ncbi:MAG TPA: hypothetical protein VMG12_01815 [Polyangiaceae bacterium]|nr:hypothetical protein [Polyangiaceae bacterium]
MLYLVPRALVNLDLYDEGIRLYGGMRVLGGALPYHDFFAYYGPAEFYWPAALFAVFGEQIIVARMGAVCFVVLALWALMQVLQRAGSGALGKLCAAAAVLVPLSVLPLFALDPSLALALGAAALLLGGFGTSRLIGAGVCLGLASTFRHDFGAYASVASVALLAVSGWERGAGRAGLLLLLRRTGVVAAAALATALAVYGPIAARDPRRVWDSLVPKLAYLMEFRSIPYRYSFGGVWRKFVFLGDSAADDLRLLLMLAPGLGALALLGMLVPPVLRDIYADRRRAGALAFLVCFGLGLCVYAFGRADYTHSYPLYCAASGALAIVLSAARRALRSPRATLVASLAFAAVMATMVGVGVDANWAEWRVRRPVALAKARWLRIDKGSRWVASLLSDVERFAGDKPVFVGSGRHDRVHKNLMLLYFLAGRPAATYYQDMLPGLTPTEEVQQRIIADLESSDARVAVQWLTKVRNEPNRSGTERGSKLLDQYLASHFAVKVKNSVYRVLVRKP